MASGYRHPGTRIGRYLNGRTRIGRLPAAGRDRNPQGPNRQGPESAVTRIGRDPNGTAACRDYPPATAETISIASPVCTLSTSHRDRGTTSPFRATATPRLDGHQCETTSAMVVPSRRSAGSPLTVDCIKISRPIRRTWNGRPGTARYLRHTSSRQDIADRVRRYRCKEDPVSVVAGGDSQSLDLRPADEGSVVG